MIAPGVVQNHATLGFTYDVGKDSELTMAYMHAFSNSGLGPQPVQSVSWGQCDRHDPEMYENSLGIAYSMKLK